MIEGKPVMIGILFGGMLMKVKPLEEVVEGLRPIAEEVGVEIVDAEWDMRNPRARRNGERT